MKFSWSANKSEIYASRWQNGYNVCKVSKAISQPTDTLDYIIANNFYALQSYYLKETAINSL